jgi:hypothetical protein
MQFNDLISLKINIIPHIFYMFIYKSYLKISLFSLMFVFIYDKYQFIFGLLYFFINVCLFYSYFVKT